MLILAAKLGDSNIAILLGTLAVASLVVGAVAVAIMARSTADIRVIGPLEAQTLARGGDLAKIFITILLFLIFGPFIALAVVAWAVLRELGVFKAKDAQLYVDAKNVDVISYEVGALILDVQARGARKYITSDESNSAMACLAFMQQVIQESFRSSFGKPGSFSIRQFIRAKGKHALFLEYDVASGGMLAPVFKTMIDVAMKEAMSRQRAAGRVFFVLDEFALLPELMHLSNGLNFGRSLGLRFVVGTQNIKQVQESYGEKMAASVLSAFGTVFAFRLYDGSSREFVRDRFGKNKKITRFESAVRNNGINENVTDGHVVEDWDLSGLPVGTCIAALPDHDPVRFTFAYSG